MELKDAVVAVKNAYDLKDYVEQQGHNVVPNGAGKWKTRCPFHNENTPSFVINDNFQNYMCFGCGKSGDIISFAMETENLSFIEVLKQLAEDKGIALEYESERSIDFASLHKILSLSAKFYLTHFNNLEDNHAAKTEITDRKLHFDNKSNELVKYGYSPNGNQLYSFLHSKGFSDDLIIQSGVCRKNEDTGNIYDFFRQRLMFIFTDRYGKAVGFSSRKIFEDDKRGKYVNSSDSPLFNKSKILYNHRLARISTLKEHVVYVCEGQFDVAAMVESGLHNTVASSGTAFTKDHVEECMRMVGAGGKVVFCFDGDSAGLKAASKVFMNFPQVHEVAEVVTFPLQDEHEEKVGSDPCDYHEVFGADALKEHVSKSIPIVEFMINQSHAKYDMSSMVSRSNFINEAVSIARTVRNNTLRDQCVRHISLLSQTPIDEIRSALREAKPLEFPPQDNNEDDSNHNRPNFDSQDNTQENDDELNNDSLENENDDHQELSLEKLKELIEADEYYKVAAKFIVIGLGRKAWRKAVVRTKEHVPADMQSIVEELNGLEQDRIFPEMFSNTSLMEFLMSDSFNPFTKFMDDYELKEHFVYLHDKLINIEKDRAISMVRSRYRDMLNQSGNDFNYAKELFKKEEDEVKKIELQYSLPSSS